MAPYLAPHAQATSPGSQGASVHLVLVPVDGKVVLSVCVLLIVACVLWMCLLWHKGLEHDKDA